MAQFTPDVVNTSFGFYGTLSDWDNISKTQVMQVYNQVVDMLAPTQLHGGDGQDKARQYLDSSSGRRFVDGLTFLIDMRSASVEDIIGALERSKTDKNTASFWKNYAKFQTYESADSPNRLVDKLLE